MEATVRNNGIKDSTIFSFLKNLLRGLFLGLAILFISLFIAVFAVPRVIGAVPLTVLSGSMTPSLNPGDLIVTLPIDHEKDEISKGNVITFQPKSGDPTLVTHRVISKGFTANGETLYVTKGDANSEQDSPIIEDQIMGKYIYRIPWIGYLTKVIPYEAKPLMIQLLGISILLWGIVQIFYSKPIKKSKDK